MNFIKRVLRRKTKILKSMRFEAEKFRTENMKAIISKVKSAKTDSFKVKLVKTAPFEET